MRVKFLQVFFFIKSTTVTRSNLSHLLHFNSIKYNNSRDVYLYIYWVSAYMG